MKRFSLLFALLVSSVAYTYAAPCLVILNTNLTRGAESGSVLLLQNFLAGKGYLKATPNGYFGPATLAAVKLYQKSVGLPQTGAVLTLTRAALAKEVCSTNGVLPPSPALAVGTTTQQATSTSQTTYYPRPTVAVLDKGTLFAGAATSTWNVMIQGSSFDTVSNTVYMRNQMNGRKYKLGIYQSPDTKTILLPNTLTQTSFSCGNTCLESLTPGNYDLTIENKGGESDPIYLTVKGFAISAQSGSLSEPVKQNAIRTRLGTISFAASVPFYVTDITASLRTEGFSGGTGVSDLTFKDEVTGTTITNFGTEVVVSENASKIIGIYGNVSSQSSGSIIGGVSVTIKDFVGNKPVTFNSPSFLTTVSGF